MTFAAASGFVAAFWIDRFDHKRALLVLYAGFIVATAFTGRFGPAGAGFQQCRAATARKLHD